MKTRFWTDHCSFVIGAMSVCGDHPVLCSSSVLWPRTDLFRPQKILYNPTLLCLIAFPLQTWQPSCIPQKITHHSSWSHYRPVHSAQANTFVGFCLISVLPLLLNLLPLVSACSRQLNMFNELLSGHGMSEKLRTLLWLMSELALKWANTSHIVFRNLTNLVSLAIFILLIHILENRILLFSNNNELKRCKNNLFKNHQHQ